MYVSIFYRKRQPFFQAVSILFYVYINYKELHEYMQTRVSYVYLCPCTRAHQSGCFIIPFVSALRTFSINIYRDDRVLTSKYSTAKHLPFYT